MTETKRTVGGAGGAALGFGAASGVAGGGSGSLGDLCYASVA